MVAALHEDAWILSGPFSSKGRVGRCPRAWRQEGAGAQETGHNREGSGIWIAGSFPKREEAFVFLKKSQPDTSGPMIGPTTLSVP